MNIFEEDRGPGHILSIRRLFDLEYIVLIDCVGYQDDGKITSRVDYVIG